MASSSSAWGGAAGGAASGSYKGASSSNMKTAGGAQAGHTVLDNEADIQRSEKFFGVSPVRFVDDVYNCASQYIKHATDQMEDTLVHDEDTRTFEPEVRAGIERASKKLYDALDKNIDKFELYIVRNIFKHLDTSASAMPLSEAATHTQEEEDAMDETLDTLRNRLQQAGYVNAAMTNRMRELDAALANISQIEETFTSADRKVAETGLTGSFEDAVGGLLSHAPEQASLLKQYEALDSLQGSQGAVAAEHPEQAVDTAFARCRAKMGAPSTRDFSQLSAVLGT